MKRESRLLAAERTTPKSKHGTISSHPLPPKHRRFKPYPAYKDSGVEWLGRVPAQWQVKRLRSTIDSCQNGVWGDEPDGLHDIVCVRVADFDRVAFRVDIADPTLRSIESRVAAARGLRAGDLLLEKSGGGENQPVGAVVHYDKDIQAVCSNFVARMVIAPGYDPRFMTFLHASLYALRINTRHIKQSTGIQNLDSASYFSEAIGLPSEPEQRTIAAFLDRKTARFDALVAKKERLIELLQEQRTALITRAVTKGLDPNATMKDSGVEWLGEIPAHWEAKHLRWAIMFQRGHDLPTEEREEGQVPVVTSSGISSTHSRAIAKAPGIVTGRYGTIGHFHLITRDYWPLNTTLYSIDLRGNEPRFLLYMLTHLSPMFLLNAVKSAVPGIDRNDIHPTRTAVPSLLEQRAIAGHLDRETARIDALIAKVREAIDRVKELRTALISAAVTGRIDVREEEL